MKVALVGATGLVGQVMVKVLEERKFPLTEFIPVASARSVGKKLDFSGRTYTISSMEAAVAAAPDLAIFSAGGSVSKEWAPRFAEVGTTVVDNSSAWRMDDSKLLVVPEINAHLLTKTDKIIANPNCSTIQMVVALAPLHKELGIDRLVISTYQSVTGTGVKAVRQYEAEIAKKPAQEVEMAYAHPIFDNCLPVCGGLEDDYTTEELKLVNETRKILGDDSLKITATCVRVPVRGGHSEAVNATFKKDFDLSGVRSMLDKADGVTVVDNPVQDEYPMPRDSEGKDDVFVGRIRRDNSAPNALNLWIVSDNLRKGAATNAVQIAEYLLAKGLLGK